MNSTLRSAYAFDTEQEVDNFNVVKILSESLGEDLSQSYIAQKTDMFASKEESNLSTTTGTDVSDASSTDGSASDHVPKSTTSYGSSCGSDGSDSDDTPHKYRLNDASHQALRNQRYPLGSGRPLSVIAAQRDAYSHSVSGSSCPTSRKKEEADTCVAAAREACASARGLGTRLGSELSLLDDEMLALSQELKALKSFIAPPADTHM